MKSGYWCWKEFLDKKQDATRVTESFLSVLFSQIWALHTTQKIKNFIWRALTNSVAIAQNLKKKRLTQANECSRCGAIEDINHLLFICPYARVIWASSPLGRYFHPFPESSVYSNLDLCFRSKDVKDQERRKLEMVWPWIIWRLWKSRNGLVLSGLDSNPQKLINQAVEDATEWQEANKKDEDRRLRAAPIINRRGRWTPPPAGRYKCNIDAIWNEKENTCGVGWILRDSVGAVKWIGAKAYPKLSSPLQAEAAALTWALPCLNNLQITEVMIENDCETLIKALKKPKDWHCLQQATLEAQVQQHRWGHSFGFAKRDANTCADVIAKVIKLCPLYFAILDNNSPWHYV